MLSVPVVLLKSAAAPVAVFSSAVLARSVPRASGSIELAGGVASERKETNRRIEATAGETKQSVLPFRGIATGVASIRVPDLPLALFRRKRKAGEHKRDEQESKPQRRLMAIDFFKRRVVILFEFSVEDWIVELLLIV